MLDGALNGPDLYLVHMPEIYTKKVQKLKLDLVELK